jgi:hypothetical protein
LYYGKSGPTICATFVNLKAAQNKPPPNKRKFAQSGVDVMITILGEKMAFSQKPML